MCGIYTQPVFSLKVKFYDKNSAMYTVLCIVELFNLKIKLERVKRGLSCWYCVPQGILSPLPYIMHNGLC